MLTRRTPSSSWPSLATHASQRIRYVVLGSLLVLSGLVLGAQSVHGQEVSAWGAATGGFEIAVSDVPTGTGFTALAGGSLHGYALRTDGSIAAWGYDVYSQVRDTPAGTVFTGIVAGGFCAYALATRTIGFTARKGALTDKPVDAKDRFKLSGSWSLTEASADGVINPLTEDVTLRLGSEAQPFVFTLPSGSPGWKATKSGFRYKSPKGVLPKLKLVLNTKKGSLKVAATKLDLPASSNPLGLELRIGDDALNWSSAWTAKKKPGAFKFKAP